MVQVCFSVLWLPYVLGALTQLLLQSTWDSDDPETISLAQSRSNNLINMFATPVCQIVPSPYWDDETDNEISLPESEQPWYGSVTDWLAPADELDFTQNIALWALTGFVAYAAGVGSAIFFRTTAKRFIIAIEAGEVAEIIRIVVDAAEFNIDTTGFEGQIIEQEVIADPELEEHDIYVIKGEF